jgi:hypothetical protein
MERFIQHVKDRTDECFDDLIFLVVEEEIEICNSMCGTG